MLGLPILDGFNGLMDYLPRALVRLDQYLRQYEWGQRALAPETIARITGVFSSAVGLLVSLLVIVVTGLYFSAEPQVYIDGVVRLAPPDKRPR